MQQKGTLQHLRLIAVAYLYLAGLHSGRCWTNGFRDEQVLYSGQYRWVLVLRGGGAGSRVVTRGEGGG